jgi:hypothetical protein
MNVVIAGAVGTSSNYVKFVDRETEVKYLE